MDHSLLISTLEFSCHLYIIEFWSRALLFSTHDRRQSMEESGPILLLRRTGSTYHIAWASVAMALAIT